MNRMAMLNQSGHTLTEWDVADEESVERAAAAFADARSRGWAAFTQANETEQPVQMHKFDPNAANILYAAPLAGG